MGGRRRRREDAEKDKKINMARAIFAMTCLYFFLYEINPIGFLHLDVECWESYALRGD